MELAEAQERAHREEWERETREREQREKGKRMIHGMMAGDLHVLLQMKKP